MNATARLRSGCIAAGLLGLLIVAPAGAQRIPQQLSVDDAIRIARENNPAYLKSLNDIDVEDMSVRNRWAAFLPTASANMNFSGNRTANLSYIDDSGRPVNEGVREEHTTSGASQGLNLSMMLFDGGQSVANLRAARATREATSARLDLDRHLLETAVAREYFAVVKADRLIDLEQRLLAARKDELERTQRLLGLASSKYVDVLSAQVNVADAERSLDDARAAAQKARLVLIERLGVSGEPTFALSTTTPEIFDPARINAEQLISRASTTSPLVRRAEADLFAQSRQVSAAKGNRLPVISASANLGRSVNGEGLGYFAGKINPDDNRSLGFSLGVQLPLFSRFNTSLTIARASAAEADAREEVRAQKLAVERAVRSALIDLGNAYRGVQMAQRKVDLSREQLAAAQEEYRLGALTFINLQQIINSAAAAERQMLDAQFNFVNNLIMLEQQVGSKLER